MAAQNYDKALKEILKHEGGYVNHPKDPGGATNYGITQRVYDAYRRERGVGIRSVKMIEIFERDTIYRVQYWDAIKGDKLPSGLDLAVFDFAVNSGVSRALKFLQQAVKTQKLDGQFGIITKDRLNQFEGLEALINLYCDRRMAYLERLKTFPVFGRGWIARVKSVRKTALAWAKDLPSPNDTSLQGTPQTNAKAPDSDLKALPTTTTADAATSAGTVTATLSQAVDALTPISTLSPNIANVVLALTVAGVVITLAGITYRQYSLKRREQALKDQGEIPL
jgi:lysozyme family protein